MESQNPGEKKQKVTEMFNGIAHRYDFLNHFLSLGIDHLWRKKLVKLATKDRPEQILDIACGTGDLSIALVKTGAKRITGLDIAVKMIEIGREKAASLKLDQTIEFIQGDSEHLPMADSQYHLVTAAFGVRNFENLDLGLQEMYRVLSSGGKVMILEFSRVEGFPWKWIFGFYFRFILPLIGKMVSGHSSAYSYLPESVSRFPSGLEFLRRLEQAGFQHTSLKKLSGGVATLYIGTKS